MAKYIVQIFVSTASLLAGTDANISCKINGSNGSTPQMVVDPQTVNNFEKGDDDPATCESPIDVGILDRIEIYTDRANSQSDCIFSMVRVTAPNGVVYQGNNPDPANGWLESANGGVYRWPLYPIDPEQLREIQIQENKRLIERRIKEAQDKAEADRRQAEGAEQEKLAVLERQLTQAENDYKRAEIQRKIDIATRKAKAATKGFYPAVELSKINPAAPAAPGNLWYALDADESMSQEGPHPGIAVAGENYLEYSNGRFPGQDGLAKGVLDFRNGQIVTAQSVVAEVYQAAQQGQQWAETLLTALGLPKPQRQRTIFDLFLGR